MPMTDRFFCSRLWKWILPLLLLVALGSTPAAGQETTDLAKKSQNPVGDLISVPLQFNFNSGGGLEDQTYFNLNIQPVVPIGLTSLGVGITRTTVFKRQPMSLGIHYFHNVEHPDNAAANLVRFNVSLLFPK